ncbi:MAG: 3-dehydroquinate synthase [Alphaproteobacteria bacterium]
MSGFSTVRVELGARGYDILVGRDLLDDAGRHVRPLVRQPRVIVITDETVAALHLPRLEAALAASGLACVQIVLPPGEKTKDFAHLRDLVEGVLDLGVDRGSTLVALGGGVIGDLVGFCASIVLRGIDFIQVPTTLLSQVDSSVGGKTGINTRHGKNLVGAFHQPRLVLADVSTLDTLPKRELLAGYSEVVKYGFIRDRAFFEWLERHGPAVRDGDAAARQHAVVASCKAKAAVVAADEREAGERALLNFGHTFGHALEAETGYGDELLHGEAVAIGMAMAFALSVRLGYCPHEEAERAKRHMETIGLPASLRAVRGRTLSVDSLLAHMRQDKKVKDGKLTFVLSRGIGKAFLSADVGMDSVEDLLETAVAA